MEAEQNSQGFLGCLKDQESKAVSLFVKGDLPIPLPTAIHIPPTLPTPTPTLNTHTHTHHILRTVTLCEESVTTQNSL